MHERVSIFLFCCTPSRSLDLLLNNNDPHTLLSSVSPSNLLSHAFPETGQLLWLWTSLSLHYSPIVSAWPERPLSLLLHVNHHWDAATNNFSISHSFYLSLAFYLFLFYCMLFKLGDNRCLTRMFMIIWFFQ